MVLIESPYSWARGGPNAISSRPLYGGALGLVQGDFDFLLKFPTWTKDLREGPAEGTREGHLSGTLAVLIAGLG